MIDLKNNKEQQLLAAKLLIGILVVFMIITFGMRMFNEDFKTTYSPAFTIIIVLGLLFGAAILWDRSRRVDNELEELQNMEKT